ncbi:GNAT family N-acetyltransferase [bacterium]|nr:GNAT family N-acetyltransferase [bacterium]MBT3730042.1 GNAT family N-acetyltransferase [bacterium]
MKNKTTIRKATVKDLDDILKLNLLLFRNEHKKFDKSVDLKWTYGKEGKKYFKDRVVKRNGFVEVVACDGKVVGYIVGGISERVSYRKSAKYAELENMLLDSKFRGQGIGRKLTKNFTDWCKKNKVDYVSVTASAKNKQAVDMYKKSGFKDYNITLEMKLK